MKYVFSISSHLTFYISNKIIEIDARNVDDCVLLLTRDYHIPEKYNSLYKNQIHTSYNVVGEQSSRVFSGINVLQTKRNIKAFDNLIDPFLQNEDFIWYTQVCSNDICSLMVTKKNCVGYYIIEDGFGSYLNTNPQTFKGWRYIAYKLVLKPFFNRIFELKNHFISTDSPKFKGCIATIETCFPLHQQYLRVIGLPFEKIDLGYTPNAILSIDPMYLFIDDEVIKKIYQELSCFIKSKCYKTITYKFHPIFYATVNSNLKAHYTQMIKNYFGEGLIELDKNTVLENVLMTYACDFYTDNSSVAIYGHELGAACYSYIPILNYYANTHRNYPLINKICIPIHHNEYM